MKLVRFIASLLPLWKWGCNHDVDTSHKTSLDTPRDIAFLNPPVSYRPRLRYWIPDAHVDLDQIYNDIAQAGARGAAGVEVLGFYLYGASPGAYVPTDWNAFGWGTPAWKQVLDTAIDAHWDHGLLMDVAMGPNQGQGVPAHEDDDGLMWDLKPHHVVVPAGKRFNGTLPGWGAGKLQAVVTGRITSTTKLKATEDDEDEDDEPRFFAAEKPPKKKIRHTLDESSLQDVTSQVSKDGWLELDAGTFSSKHSTLCFAVYLVRSGAHTQQPPSILKGPQTTPTDYVHNGSWTVDHFSARGARVLTDFWETNLLVNGTREHLQEVARCMWEDSIEINPNVYWTPDLPRKFARSHGYSLGKYLPLLFHGNSLVDHFSESFVTDEPDAGHSHVAAYRTTLTEGYGEYLDALREWAKSCFGGDVAWSSQIGYNMAVDMQALVAKADLPECEDLAFASNIDAYRQFTSPAYLANKNIVSAEVGAVLGHAYQMTVPRWLQLIHRLFAGGVNAVVMHGLAYSGAYPNTTWPGYAPFTYAWSDMLGRHQPAWDFFGGPFDYLSRTMYLLQQGVPKLDIAFYQKQTTYKTPTTNYEPEDLLRAGYTYGYLDPETLASPEAVVHNGILAPSKQAYKALIVRSSDTISTARDADTLAKLAHAGLPVIFAGHSLPSFLGSHHNPAGKVYVHQTLHSLRLLPNVHHVPDEDGLCEVVASLGIEPHTRVRSSGKWWTVWREDTDRQFAFVYHDGDEPSSGSIEFQSTGRPYQYDAATGQVTPIGVYSQKGGRTKIHLEIGPHQAILVGFHNDESLGVHATSTSKGVVDVRRENGQLVALVASSSSQWVRTSDGVSYYVHIHNVPPPLHLNEWTLTVEHWDPPQPLTNIEAGPHKWNSSHNLKELVSWQDIPGLRNVSGRGYYTTTFDWSGNGGALLSLGPVIHTLVVTINGYSQHALTSDAIDISSFLVAGRNTLTVVVATTLANCLAPIWDSLRTSGAPPTGLFGSETRPPGDAEYGLLGPITVRPYRKVTLEKGEVESDEQGLGLVKQVN
ncbi:hypothetical protein Sste5346_007131 [Sporothrix stenoceras]|uniref:Secreted protein n=1 Tax=Sporothrix stenoceras TaxID=5173 RepID=A0ABR3YXA8_9PEZI